MRQNLLIFAGLVLLAATPAMGNVIFKAGFEPAKPVVAQVRISPGSRLLTTVGETAMLTAEVEVDAGGLMIAEIHWHSNDPTTVSVSQDGMITVMQAAGSAQITASAPGALPATILVIVATPVPGALLIADDQVMEHPAPVDAMADYGLGYQYSIVLQGIATPQVGDILIGTGDTPLAGRVVAVSAAMAQVTVTLEVIALDELFTTLIIRERFNLERGTVLIDSAVSAAFTATQYDDGSIVFLSRATAKGVQGTAVNPLLDCSDSDVTNPLDILSVSTAGELLLDPAISVEVAYNSDSGHFELTGSGAINSVFELKPRVVAAFEGKISCKLKLAQLVIPIGGPLSWVFSGQIPLGAGVEVSGKVSTTEQVGYDLTAAGNQSFSASLNCAPDCTLDSNLELSFDGVARPVLPMVDPLIGNFELDLNGFLFAFASLKFGNPLLTALQFEALSVKAGIKQSGAFRTVAAQAADPNFASSFKLELTGDAGAGSDILNFLSMLTITPPSFSLFSISLPLANSPAGTLVITDPSGGSSSTAANPARVAAGNAGALGDLATFEVTLNPTTYLGQYSVEGVDIYWQRPDGSGGTMLEPGRPGCNAMNATAGQTVFTCQADFTQDHLGTQNFYAFVRASLFGFEVLFPLEVAADSVARVEVVEAMTPTDITGFYDAGASVSGIGAATTTCGETVEVILDQQQDVNEHALARAAPGRLDFLVDTSHTTEDRIGDVFGSSGAHAVVTFPAFGDSLEFVVTLDADIIPGWRPGDTGSGRIEIQIGAGESFGPDSDPASKRSSNVGILGGVQLEGYSALCASDEEDDTVTCSPNDIDSGGVLTDYDGGRVTIPVSFLGTGAPFHWVSVQISSSFRAGFKVDGMVSFPGFGAFCAP